MLISEVGIRGFKSYGNNEQVLKLNTDRGDLILLVGNNGAGKSSLLDSFDYVLYGKVRGKKKKWTTLSNLPNRINGELQNRIKFVSGGTEVEVVRGISPNVLKLIENGLENDRAGKANLDEKIENYIGLDIETFKSFISMSINDFKNFISLSTEEKQLLLDKLFNLEIINILNQILKDLNKANKLQLTKYDSEINTIDDSISRIKSSIAKAIEKEKQNIQGEIDKIKAEMEAKKEDYQTLKDKVEKIKAKDKELKEDLDKERDQYIRLQSEIKNAQKDIDLYDSGKCPTCGTDFDNEHFHNLKGTLIEKKTSLDNLKVEIEDNIRKVKERQTKLQSMSDEANKAFNDLTYLLKNYKSQIDKLQLQKDSESGKSSANTEEFEKTIKELEEKRAVSYEYIATSKDKELYYKELNKIFGEDGVKKSIIAGIIKPINHFIAENTKKMHLPFQVSLDETFTAEIKQFGNVIEHDSLSTGETKKVNIAILIAYLKLIRTKKHINILFLDEVFSSIDIEGIQSILDLLKSFANDYNINIFVVHHAILNQETFDRIIKINKDVFSTIEEVQIESEEIYPELEIENA
jgi:DNA repair exonuclease SbcCD ATPase subunit